MKEVVLIHSVCCLDFRSLSSESVRPDKAINVVF